MDFSSDPKEFEGPNLSIECAWIQSKDEFGIDKSTTRGVSQNVDDDTHMEDCCDSGVDVHNADSKRDDDPFVLPLPLKRARDVLELLANIKITETCPSDDADEYI